MKKHYPIFLILILGLLLRLYHNTNLSLWHDEAFSALLIKYPWQEMLYRIGLDVHPPAYYIFLRIWHYIFSDSLLSLRLFSVFFGVGTIWGVWLLVKIIFESRRLAIITAFLVAVNTFQIQYATEARMYTMGAFFTVMACYFTVQFLKHWHELNKLTLPYNSEEFKDKKVLFWNWLGMVVSMIVMIYTHYYLLFSVLAICLFFVIDLLWHRVSTFGRKIWLILLTGFSLILAFLPWLNVFLFQVKQVGSGYWIPPMDIWSVPTTLYTLIFGFSYDINNLKVQALLVVVTVAFLFVIYKFIKQTKNFYKWLIVLVTLAPFLGSGLFYLLARAQGSHSSVYLVRYFVFTSPFLIIILATWLQQIKHQNLFKIILFAYVILCFFSFYRYWHNVNISTRPGMNKAIKYLEANLQSQDKLYSASSFMFFNLKYYLNQSFKTKVSAPTLLLYSGGIREVNNLPHYAGTAILNNSDLLADLNQNIKIGDIVWLVWTNGFGANKPDVPKNWNEITVQEFPEVRPYLGTSVFVSEYQVKE
jgi:uncharacterized membrane protein